MADVAAIQKQVEFYFSDSNFRRDKFLQAETAKNADRFVPFSVLFTFKKLQALTTDAAVLASALEKSTVVEMNEDRTALRRIHAATLSDEDASKRTVAFSGLGVLPPTIDQVNEAFDADKVAYTRIVKAAGRFFGVVHVEFKDEATADAIVADKTIAIVGRNPKKMRLSEYLALSHDDKRDFEKGIQAMLKATGVPADATFQDTVTALEGLWDDDRAKKPLINFFEDLHELNLLYQQVSAAAEALAYFEAHPVEILGTKLSFELVSDEDALAARPRKDSKKRKVDNADRKYVCITAIGKSVRMLDVKDLVVQALGSSGVRVPFIEFQTGSSLAKINCTDNTQATAVYEALSNLTPAPQLGGKTPHFHLLTVGDEPAVEVDYENGLIVKLTGVPSDVSRDVIKEKLNELLGETGVVAYIQFQLGQTEALLRVDVPKAATKLVELISSGDVAVKDQKIGGAEILTGDDEKAFWVDAETARRARFVQTDSNKRQRQGDYGGRGGPVRKLAYVMRLGIARTTERAVIAKESALIRTAFKDNDKQYRHRNVAKLLFIHMLGYPSHFGQMECLKLIAANNFSEKRIGYLGLMLLLTDQEEVLTLVTNSLKKYVIRQLDTSTSHFVEPILDLLRSKNHAVLLTGVQLIIDLLLIDRAVHGEYFKGIVPALVRELRNLLSNNYTPEYDVSGIVDPFLQVNILRCYNEEASEAMNDVLAQVATNTETSKNAGNAILYECVSTIMSIQSESGLKVLAINILGRLERALSLALVVTMVQVIADDAPAVQRHRNTIVDCLKDPDLSIRQRALELIYALVNESNIQAVRLTATASVHELSGHAVERYAPTQRWHIDTLITMLSIAGSILPDEHISSSLIVLIQKNPALHVYVVHKLFWALKEDMSQLALAHVGLWCIGEYGRALCGSDPPADEETLQGKTRVDEAVVVDLVSTQRSSEFAGLLEPQWSGIRGDILAPMPMIDMTRVRTRQSQLLAFSAPATSADFDEAAPTNGSSAPPTTAPVNLLDLDNIFGTSAATTAPTTATPAPPAATPAVDLLADLFSSGPAPPSAMAVAPVVQPPGQHIRAYEKNGLALDIELSKPNLSDPSISHILCLFTNKSAYQLDNFVFQAAFPKVPIEWRDGLFTFV
ncbi:hypothetical protein DYB32_002864 [Aphanomyces invadans]|uniref:HTH La-type RNA-binding domain-containing protein n=1 Tax=Aphanomyces invadans TaxID=157072 RepID=A0A3R6WPV8_9STRA|nr:hypothetical protein DYB32_002864 [Aphanomyces invadans]